MEDGARVEPASVVEPVRIGAVSVRTLTIAVSVTIAVTVGLGVAAAAVHLKALQFPGRDDLYYLFNLDSEFNVPTMVSVLGLTLCAVALAVVGGVARTRAPRDATRLKVLAGIFLYLALDEASRWHERLNEPMRAVLDAEVVRFGWVVVFGAVVLALVPLYLPLVWRLPPLARAMSLAAAALYVGGALVAEIAGAWVYDPRTARYVLLTVVEETAELAGVGLFLVALRVLLGRWAPVLVADLGPRDTSTSAGA